MSSRVLVVNANWLGDVLFSTPALRALKISGRAAHLTVMVPPRCADALRGNPHVDEILVAPDRKLWRRPADLLRVAGDLAQGRYDTAIFFKRSRTKALLAGLAGIRERAGYSSGAFGESLTRPLGLPPRDVHRIDLYLEIAKRLGVEPAGRVPEFHPTDADRSMARELLASRGVGKSQPYVVAHAGGNWDLKRWPAGHFSRWIRLFRARRPWIVVLCGTAAERPLVERLRTEAADTGVVSICGETSLGALAAVLSAAKFLITNDSGPIHLAATQKTPILGLFGPTSPERTGPVSDGRVSIVRRDPGCEIPCYFRSCDHRLCMEAITPEAVLEEAERLA